MTRSVLRFILSSAMNQLSTTVTQKGQVTIPVALRKKFGIVTNTQVVISEGKKFLEIKPVLSIEQLAGCLKRPGQKPLSVAAMRRFRANGSVFGKHDLN